MQPSLPWSARDRVPYEPITHRAPFTLPGNARVAVWTIVNVENWQPGWRCPVRCCRRPWVSRCCPTSPTGAGTNTACASASGVSWMC